MKPVMCQICGEPIIETGTGIDGWPVHIHCYHKYEQHEWFEDFGMVLCRWCGVVKRLESLNKPCSKVMPTISLRKEQTHD